MRNPTPSVIPFSARLTRRSDLQCWLSFRTSQHFPLLSHPAVLNYLRKQSGDGDGTEGGGGMLGGRGRRGGGGRGGGRGVEGQEGGGANNNNNNNLLDLIAFLPV